MEVTLNHLSHITCLNTVQLYVLLQSMVYSLLHRMTYKHRNHMHTHIFLLQHLVLSRLRGSKRTPTNKFHPSSLAVALVSINILTRTFPLHILTQSEARGGLKHPPGGRILYNAATDVDDSLSLALKRYFRWVQRRAAHCGRRTGTGGFINNQLHMAAVWVDVWEPRRHFAFPLPGVEIITQLAVNKKRGEKKKERFPAKLWVFGGRCYCCWNNHNNNLRPA